MQVGKYNVSYDKTYRPAGKRLMHVHFAVDDPDGKYNYVAVTHRCGGGFRSHIGYAPSVLSHRVIGDYATPAEAVDAALCELRIRSYEPGTLDYVKAYRDKWLKGVEILRQVPEGWHEMKGATTAPIGAKWVGHGSRFDPGYQHALLYQGI